MKIGLLTATSDGFFVAEKLKKFIDEIIYLKSLSNKYEISGEISELNKQDIKGTNISYVSDYSLKNKNDLETIKKLDLDILIVFGWQRLIPPNVLDNIRIGVIGAHGSSRGITSGRGRAPQNWALILGHDEFEISIFWIDRNIDSGRIISSKKFNIDQTDDINVMHIKTSFAVVKMLDEFLNSEVSYQKGILQNEKEAQYLPKRNPEDGIIDFNLRFREFENFTRALSWPYPNARFYFLGFQFKFNSCKYIENSDNYANLPNGFVLGSVLNRCLVIKITDSIVLLESVCCLTKNDELFPEFGDILTGESLVSSLEKIFTRHNSKYPNLPIARYLLEFADYLRNY